MSDPDIFEYQAQAEEHGRRLQREADAKLADRTAALHEDMLPNAPSETEAAGHRAIACAMRSLARQIRSGG